MLQGGGAVMFIKFLRVRWNCYVERTQKQRIKKNYKSCNGSNKEERRATEEKKTERRG